MKKILSILGIMTMIGTVAPVVVGCHPHHKFSDAQVLLNKITKTNITIASNVPTLTSNTKTQKAIKNGLKNDNPALNDDDLTKIQITSSLPLNKDKTTIGLQAIVNSSKANKNITVVKTPSQGSALLKKINTANPYYVANQNSSSITSRDVIFQKKIKQDLLSRNNTLTQGEVDAITFPKTAVTLSLDEAPIALTLESDSATTKIKVVYSTTSQALKNQVPKIVAIPGGTAKTFDDKKVLVAVTDAVYNKFSSAYQKVTIKNRLRISYVWQAGDGKSATPGLAYKYKVTIIGADEASSTKDVSVVWTPTTITLTNKNINVAFDTTVNIKNATTQDRIIVALFEANNSEKNNEGNILENLYQLGLITITGQTLTPGVAVAVDIALRGANSIPVQVKLSNPTANQILGIIKNSHILMNPVILPSGTDPDTTHQATITAIKTKIKSEIGASITDADVALITFAKDTLSPSKVKSIACTIKTKIQGDNPATFLIQLKIAS